MNTCTVHHEERLYDAVFNRSRDRPLITIMNHRSFVDGLFMGNQLRWNYFTRFDKCIPWSTAATEFAFFNVIISTYFSLIKTVPISRGEGIHQPSMNFLLNRLDHGEWIHIFPEGKINMNNENLEYKLGVSRCIAESKERPIIIPIYQIGTHEVMPTRRPVYPRIGKRMTVLIGKPIHFCDELEESIKLKHKTKEMWPNIAHALHEEMDMLGKEATTLHMQTIQC